MNDQYCVSVAPEIALNRFRKYGNCSVLFYRTRRGRGRVAENYTIREQDCVASLAYSRGFTVDTLWNNPKNAELKKQRVDPYLLEPGDVLYIPDLTIKEEPRPTEARHKFKKLGTPAKLRLRLTQQVLVQPPAGGDSDDVAAGTEETVSDDDTSKPSDFKTEPRANVKYTLNVEGTLYSGTTDGGGILEQQIRPNAMSATLTLEPGTSEETVLQLSLGGLDPQSEISGTKQRLANLGFDCGEYGAQATDDFSAALAAFQEWNGIPVTGALDDDTRQALGTAHGA
jgi:hypothetical protein